MKILRAFSIGLTGLVTFVGCALLGAAISIERSHAHDIGAFGVGIAGLMMGSLVGVIAAFAVAKLFADHIWVAENKRDESPAGELQQQAVRELESDNPDLERRRVEKYGLKIVVCSSCGTKNSLSFPRCINCAMDLGKEQPVDNPYL